MSWNSPSHLRSVAQQLDRRDAGVLDYLVVRAGDEIVCIGAVDFEPFAGAGEIMQLGTKPGHEGRGYATRLIATAERRMATRGVGTARLSVEPENERAMRLYRHLGYEPTGEREVGWATDDGWYSTMVVDLEKQLTDDRRP